MKRALSLRENLKQRRSKQKQRHLQSAKQAKLQKLKLSSCSCGTIHKMIESWEKAVDKFLKSERAREDRFYKHQQELVKLQNENELKMMELFLRFQNASTGTAFGSAPGAYPMLQTQPQLQQPQQPQQLLRQPQPQQLQPPIAFTYGTMSVQEKTITSTQNIMSAVQGKSLQILLSNPSLFSTYGFSGDANSSLNMSSFVSSCSSVSDSSFNSAENWVPHISLFWESICFRL